MRTPGIVTPAERLATTPIRACIAHTNTEFTLIHGSEEISYEDYNSILNATNQVLGIINILLPDGDAGKSLARTLRTLRAIPNCIAYAAAEGRA